MGGAGSSHKKHKKMREKDFKALADTTRFSLDEIRSFYTIFTDLAQAEALLDPPRLAALLGLSSTNLASRILSAFGGPGGLTFPGLCHGLSAIASRASQRERAEFVFRLYDSTGSGYITKDSVREMLQACLEENKAVTLTDQQLDKICDKTMSDFDNDGDGKITLEDFQEAVEHNPGILTIVSLSFE